MNNIGFNIKRLRDQKGYSQEFMASQLDITQASYARIESQKIKLSIDRLQKIAVM
jgi:transcriptional regulator with XRE-family HTH domain